MFCPGVGTVIGGIIGGISGGLLGGWIYSKVSGSDHLTKLELKKVREAQSQKLAEIKDNLNK